MREWYKEERVANTVATEIVVLRNHLWEVELTTKIEDVSHTFHYAYWAVWEKWRDGDCGSAEPVNENGSM